MLHFPSDDFFASRNRETKAYKPLQALGSTR